MHADVPNATVHQIGLIVDYSDYFGIKRVIRGTQRGYSSKPLNIAFLNVFWYLNGRYRHIFIP